jgi:proline iminopeptidase
MRTEEGFVQVTGGRIWYKVVGDGPKTPLLVVHGGPGFPHDYLEPLQGLADDRLVVFYDQLGCGNSDRPSDLSLWNIDRFAEELVLLREHLDLDEAHIYGHSWGSILAVHYLTTKGPLGVRSLVLSSPSMSIPRSYEDMRRYLDEMPADVRMAVHEAEGRGDTSTPEFRRAVRLYNRRHLCRVDPPPECMKRAHSKSSREISDHFLGWRDFQITGYMRHFDCTEELIRIDVPTLFVCGEHDDACPESTKHYHRMLPGSELVIVEGASHNPQLERGDLYIRILRDFLRRNDR